MTEPYRPQSGTECADFMEFWCERCIRDEAYRNGTGDSCPIASAATGTFVLEDTTHPKEWVIEGNRPRCTAFEAAQMPEQANG